MGYIPEDAKWYIAEIVEEIAVEDDSRNIVHVNFNLIRADSPEDAYSKAIELGQSGETEYFNPESKRVRICFRGLRDLKIIYDELEHGAELMFEQTVGIAQNNLNELLKTKEQLEVFQPWRPPDFSKRPDYAAKDIIDEVEAKFGLRRFDGMGRKDDSNGSNNR